MTTDLDRVKEALARATADIRKVHPKERRAAQLLIVNAAPAMIEEIEVLRGEVASERTMRITAAEERGDAYAQLSRVERERDALKARVEKVRADYLSQAKFADYEAAAYFRDFAERLARSLLNDQTGKGE